MDNLNHDIVQHILSFFHMPSLYSFSATSHHFRKIVENRFQMFCLDLSSSPMGIRYEGKPITLWMQQYKMLMESGKFETIDIKLQKQSYYGGTEVQQNGTILLKTKGSPDSNNVFLRHRLKSGRFFVEFLIHNTFDEMVIGTSNDPESVRRLSGWGNVNRKDTWVYSKKSSNFGMVYFPPKMNIYGKNYFQELDKVAIYIDADKREVCWYKNGKFVATNLPEYPLEETDEGYGVYVQVDQEKDKVEILRFGYNNPPYVNLVEDVREWEDIKQAKLKKAK